MPARRRLDRRRDDLCAGVLRKHVWNAQRLVEAGDFTVHRGGFTSIDYPSALATDVFGINAQGDKLQF
jgi:hypothetical protein